MGVKPSADNKLIIYQLLPRLFGNTKTVNKTYGSIEENGVGKFNDITDKALSEIKAMGFTYIFYTGVIKHATMTDYSAFGIKPDDPDVVKGRAGSPFAIKDYYDVDPDLAVDVKNRMAECEALIARTHASGMKVIMDFVPNHVARAYASDVKPAGVHDFGQDDDKTKAFDTKNDFYYIPGQPFIVPPGYNPGGDNFTSPLKDGKFDENPAKATGDNVFTPAPLINNWFETVKLNYGIDFTANKTYFDPPPPLWNKLYDILSYWCKKGADGFRCDMIEFVPVEFWNWLISKLKTDYPELIFIGEAYKTELYHTYIFEGKFDYLYDKAGLYTAIRKLTRNEPDATTWDINNVWNNQTNGIDGHMLRFMENHDEQRVASDDFAGNAWYAIPGMIVTATLSTGPVMIYFGQEVGEPGVGIKGFSAEDARTSIYDYWGVPEHQKWLNYGLFDGGQLSANQKNLRRSYSNLLNIVHNNEALNAGKFYELMMTNQYQPGFDQHIYIYLRYTVKQRILVIANFNRYESSLQIKLPDDLITEFNLKGNTEFIDLLSGTKYNSADISQGLSITLQQVSGMLLQF